MAKKSQIDKALDALANQRGELVANHMAAVAGIDAAVAVLKQQQRKVTKPRAVAKASEVLAG
jgi:hypothetical protein